MNPILQAIEAMDPPTQVELARVCGQKPQAVTRWINTGTVPAHHCAAIERATKGAIRADELRPDVVWQRDAEGRVTGYLVELVEREPATQPETA